MAGMTLAQLQALVEQQGTELAKLKAAAAATTPAPTEYHVLQKSAEEIDEFFAEGGGTKNAVRYDTAQSLTTVQQAQARTNINAAPDGYGFGANAKYLTASDNIDTLVASGIYQWKGNSAPQGTLPTTLLSYARNLFVMNNGGTCVQTAVDTSDSNYHGCAIRRTIYGSRVFPWEWVNPPMVVGVEYRTTERYLGKPVYVKAVDCGAVPSNAQKIISMGVSGFITKIRCDAFADSTADVFTIPRKVNTTEVTATLASSANNIYINSNTDTLGNYNVYVIAYYTK